MNRRPPDPAPSSAELNLRHLRTLIAVEEEGGFDAAARRIGRTQSAVTQQMQQLESNVGTPLFVARGRRRELTSAGATVVRYARSIVSLCTQALAAAGRGQETGAIALGAPQEIAEVMLPDVLRRFAERWPGIHVTLRIDRSPVLMKMLEEHALDVTLSTRRSDSDESVLLTRLPAVWLAGEGWRPAPGAPLPLVLTNEPSLFRRIALAALDLDGRPYVERLTSPSLAGLRLAVASGLGVTVRTRGSLLDGARVLDETQGFPPLPVVSYYLHRPLLDASEPARDLFALIADRAREGGRS